jgi:hypothetical protein
MSITVIPAKAGTQSLHKSRGEASQNRARLGPGLRRDDDSVFDRLLRGFVASCDNFFSHKATKPQRTAVG